MDTPSTIPLSKFSYLVAVLKICNLLNIDTKGILKELPNQSGGTGYTFVVEFSCLAIKVHATGNSLCKAQAKMNACKNALIQIVYHLRLCESTLSLADYALSEEDLNEYDRRLPDKQNSFLTARALWALFQLARANKSAHPVVQPKEEAKLELPSNSTASINSPTVSSTTFQPKFNYALALQQLCHKKIKNGGYIYRQLIDESSSTRTKFTVVLEFIYLGAKVRAFGSGPDEKEARSQACKNGLTRLIYSLRIREPDLSLTEYGLSEKDLADYSKSLTSDPKSPEKTVGPAVQTKEAELLSNANASYKSAASSTIFQSKFSYALALQQLCHKKIKNDGFIYRHLIDQSSSTGTKFTVMVEFIYLGAKVQALGSGPDEKEAKSKACKNGLIKLVYSLRICEPDLSLAQYGLSEKDLADYSKSLTSDAKLPEKTAVQAKEAEPLSSAKASINSSTVSSTAAQSKSFSYGCRVHQFCHLNRDASYALKELTDQSSSTKFSFMIEIWCSGTKMQAFGSGPDRNLAKSATFKNGLIKLVRHLRVSNPALSLDEFGLTEEELTNDLSVKTVDPAVQTEPELKTLKTLSSSKISISSSTVSSTAYEPKFNYLAAMHRFCNQLKIDTSDIFKEQPYQSGSMEFTFKLEMSLGAKVQAFGSGPSKTQARMKACKNAFIQIFYYLRLCEPTFPLKQFGLTEGELADYGQRLTDEQAQNTEKAVLFLRDRIEKVTNSAVQTKEAEPLSNANASINSSMNSSTVSLAVSSISAQPKFNHLAVVHGLCLQNPDASYVLQELPDSSDAETKLMLEIRYSGIKVRAFGSGSSKKKAKLEACKNGLIKLVPHLRARDPSLSLIKLGLTENDIARSDHQLTSGSSAKLPEKTADSAIQTRETEPLSSSRASINFLAPSSSSASTNWRDDIVLFQGSSSLTPNGETLSNRPVGLFAKAPSANGFQHANGFHQKARHSSGPADVKKPPNSSETTSETTSETKIDSQQNSSTNVEQPVAKSGEQENESLLTQVQKLLSKFEITCSNGNISELKKLTPSANTSADVSTDAPTDAKADASASKSDHSPCSDQSDWETVQEAVAYLGENKDVFDEIIELHDENASISYTTLIRQLVKQMPQRKLKYEFSLSDTSAFGIGRLLYEGRCFQTAFRQASHPDLDVLEESCAKRMFYVLKLNYMS